MTEDEQWRVLIAVVGRQLPELVEKFLTRILPDPAYADSGLTLEDLRRSSFRSFAAMLAALGGDASEIDALAGIAPADVTLVKGNDWKNVSEKLD